jgi:FAD:protein FMN transferase
MSELSLRAAGGRGVRPYITVLLVAIGCSGATPQQDQAQDQGFVLRENREIMSTVFEVSVAAGPQDEPATVRPALEAALDEVARIERVMSPYITDSELSQVNAAAGGEAVVVSAELYGVVERAVALCVETGGLVDISFMPLGRIWDFRAEPFVPPSDEAIAEARALVDCEAVELDSAVGTLRLPREGMALGLGAVAKGYAVDRASAVLSQAGFANHLVNGGGDVLGRGAKPDGAWMVGIRHPRQDGGLMGRMPLRDASMVTSGDYERFVEVEGVRYHHIIDPRTGWPAQGLVSVSVMADNAERADGLATALLAAGPDEAERLVQALELEALLVLQDGSYQVSRGIASRAQLEGEGTMPEPAPEPEGAPAEPPAE